VLQTGVPDTRPEDLQQPCWPRRLYLRRDVGADEAFSLSAKSSGSWASGGVTPPLEDAFVGGLGCIPRKIEWGSVSREVLTSLTVGGSGVMNSSTIRESDILICTLPMFMGKFSFSCLMRIAGMLITKFVCEVITVLQEG
jgi:hypothetical protein